MTEADLDAFASELRQDVMNSAEADEGESFRTDAFTRRMIEDLTEAGELNDGEACFYAARGMEVSGYSADDESGALDLFATIYRQTIPIPTIPKTDVETAFRRLKGFLVKSLEGHHHQLEEASPSFDMALRIHDLADHLERVRLFLFTDGLTTDAVQTLPPELVGDTRATFHVWDIRRYFRCVSSGQRLDPIRVDFVERFGRPLQCLAAPSTTGDYSAFLAIVPGDILSGLYEEFGSRLLERNVRAFLQARGKVNAGIRRTLAEEPARFLAYNNGISCTASAVELMPAGDGEVAIRIVDDLQIVNGGQTTASIHNSATRDRVDVSKVYVQAKLTVVDSADLDEIVPLISRYANSQNRVAEADFFANDPFHIAIEALSRSTWAPAIGGSQFQTRWFYERARGQYQDALARERTPARKRTFRKLHPNPQKFTKTDLAKFENTWDQLPHLVSLGAQKNFREFTLRLQERGRFTPDETYFEALVAKAILFRSAERIVSAEEFGGYRANIVTYSLAYLSNSSAQRIDLNAIWRQQALADPLRDAIATVSRSVYSVITSPAGGANVTEWCKRKACWERVQALEIQLPENLKEVFLPEKTGGRKGAVSGIEAPDDLEMELILEAAAVPAAEWFSVSGWAKETNNLLPWQRGLAYSLGRYASNGTLPSRKQAAQGLALLEKARGLGFRRDLER